MYASSQISKSPSTKLFPGLQRGQARHLSSKEDDRLLSSQMKMFRLLNYKKSKTTILQVIGWKGSSMKLH